MCGIAGAFGGGGEDRIRRMIGAIRHRGPDSAGEHAVGAIQLGVCRLSIIDLDASDQPIVNPARGTAIVFNGEIYNYRELRHRLQRKGHVFTTDGDTEVVLRLYEEDGPACVHHLRGMFAFAIADGETLFLARDRLGIKPLYYFHADRAVDPMFLFASEIKALLQCPEVPVELDHQAAIDSLLVTHLVGSRTCIRAIESLEAGCTMHIARRGDGIAVERRRYYSPSLEPDESIPFETAARMLHEILADTVRAHLVADVEVGLMLSGGLDSGALAALMRGATDAPLRAFTIAAEASHPDVRSACGIAADLQFRHEIRIPTFAEFVAAIPAWIACNEALPRLGGVTVLLLAQAVRRHMKVCLCGEGSDEIFGGYSDFGERFVALEYFRRMAPRLRAAGFEPSAALAGVIDEIEAAERQGEDSYLRAVFGYHQRHALVPNHLDAFDRAGMAASVEIRVPYVDHVLVDFVNRLPLAYKVDVAARQRKHILRRIAVNGYPSALGPAAQRTKIGMPSACYDHIRRFERVCSAVLPADYRAHHPLGACFLSSAHLLLFEMFETIVIDYRGTVPASFDVGEFIDARVTTADRTTFSQLNAATV